MHVTARSRRWAGASLIAAALFASPVLGTGCSDDGDTVVLRSDDRGGKPEPVGSNPAAAGKALPDVQLTDAAGAKVKLRSLAGKPLVINLWNSTCGPCKRELPAFAEVSKSLGAQVSFIGVNGVDSPEEGARFAAGYGVAYPLYGDLDAELSSALGIATLPVTLFVRPDGTIQAQTGPLDAAQLRARVDALRGG